MNKINNLKTIADVSELTSEENLREIAKTSIFDVLVSVETLGSARANRNSVLILSSGLKAFCESYPDFNLTKGVCPDYYVATESDSGEKLVYPLEDDFSNVDIDDYSFVLFSIYKQKTSGSLYDFNEIDFVAPVLIKELKFRKRGRSIHSRDLDEALDQLDMKIMH